MTDQELRKLNRRDLLELLVSQSRERDYMQAKQKAQAYWSEVSGRLKHFYEDYRELKEILAFGGQK